MKQQLQQQQCWDYSFYTSSGRQKFACYKPCPTRDETHNLQIVLPRMLMLLVFSILPALHTQDTFVLILNFDVDHFAHHFLLLSFFLPSFLLVLLWKEFNPHSFVVTFHFSHLFSSPPVFFYPVEDGCWIHVNISCSGCICSMLRIVFLNDEPWLSYQRQQSTGSASQFHYRVGGGIKSHLAVEKVCGWA